MHHPDILPSTNESEKSYFLKIISKLEAKVAYLQAQLDAQNASSIVMRHAMQDDVVHRNYRRSKILK